MKILFQNHTISNICKKNIDKTLVKFPHFSYLCKEFIKWISMYNFGFNDITSTKQVNKSYA